MSKIGDYLMDIITIACFIASMLILLYLAVISAQEMIFNPNISVKIACGVFAVVDMFYIMHVFYKIDQ